MSMFAATICSSVTSPAALRENLLRRGSVASTTASPSPCGLRDRHPVADRRKRLARLGAMTQASAHAGEAFAGGGVDAVDVLVFERDARGLPLTLGMRGERRGERIVPPECAQPVWFHPVLSVPQ